jgi:23S rRNA (uracil1939-C5)-methyltransferase
MGYLMEAVTQAHRSGTIRVEEPLYGGSFTTDSGATTSLVLPGERIVCSPELAVLEPSAARVVPRCAHFGSCGGCQYQHAAYATQLLLKRQILEGLLAPYAPLPQVQTVFGPEWGYRNRIRLRIENTAEGQVRAGYSLRGSNDFLPIRMCPIAAPALWKAAETILQLSADDPLIRRWLAITSELELFTIPDESRLQLQLFLRTADGAIREASSFAGLCARLQSALPQLAGAGASLDPELNRRSRRRWQGVAWGADGLGYPAAGRTYWLPRGAFFQVNRFLVDQLAGIVTLGEQGELAWDLYAGVGLFSRVLADRFSRVVAVEGAEAAIPSLLAAARSQRAIEPVHSATLDFLRAREIQRERPTLIVLDPPRAGLGPEAAKILGRLGAPRLVYISCDPESLILDLAHLIPTHEVTAIHLIDLFPETFHLETIVQLKRK